MTKTTTLTRATALLLTALLTMAACSSGSSGDEFSATTSLGSAATTAPGDATDAPAEEATAPSRTDDGDAATEEPAAAEPGETGGGTTVGGLDSLSPADIGRDIVFTAQLVVAVDNVAVAGQAALDAVAPLGGLLFGQDTTTDPRPRTVLVIKVLPEDFSEALSRLAGIGELRSQQVNADDVTDRIVDLESRIITAEASVERLRTLLEGAVGLDEVAALERELLSREQSLEQLRGQLRTIRDAVGLATITMTIEQLVVPEPAPALDAEVTFYVGADDGRGCPSDADTTVDEGDVVTVCVEVRNVGDTLLGDVEIVDRQLDLETEDFVRLTSSDDGLLAPEATWIYAATIDASESASLETRVTATAYEQADDNPAAVALDGVGVSTVAFGFVEVTPDNSLPGFKDAFDAAVAVLALLVGLLVLAAGVIIPFLWVGVIVAAVVWIRRRRRPTESSTTTVPNAPDAAAGATTLDE